jgi:serine/threonine protein kinase
VSCRGCIVGVEKLPDISNTGVIFFSPFQSQRHDSHIKLADFGFAARVHAPKSLTKQCGTPFFVAPEILMRKSYDQKSDMWSVGCIIYLLLSGNLPFMGRSQKELFRNIVVGRFEFDDDSWTDISDQARDIVCKLLVTDPDRRLSSVACLQHPWLQQDSKRLSLIKLQGTSQRLKTFNARMKLRSAMIAVDWASSIRSKSFKRLPYAKKPKRSKKVKEDEDSESS